MSTIGNHDSSGPALEPPASDQAHSGLVTQLVAEAFSEFSRLAQPASVGPEIPGVPGPPAGEAPSSITPVHPSAQPAAPKLAEPEKTSSGAHSPDSGESYAFGEPRGNGSYRPQGNRPD